MTCCDDVAKSPSAKLKSREAPVKGERAQSIGLEEIYWFKFAKEIKD
jgi:hypothetical protein